MRRLCAAFLTLVVASCAAAPAYAPSRAYEVLENSVLIETDGGHGSGVVIADGLVLTAAHVYKEGAASVTFNDGSTAEGVWRVLWPDSDVATITVATGAAPSRVDCRPLQVGDDVVAIGSPHFLRFAASPLTVAAVKSQPEAPSNTVLVVGAVYPGNSGGPVADRAGAVRGLLTMKANGMAYGIVRPASHWCRLLGLDLAAVSP